MKLSKEQITDGIGTVTINGRCTIPSVIQVFINNKKVFDNYVDPKPIISGTLNYSGQFELATFNIELNSSIHYDEYMIKCTKGKVHIGAVHEHFHKDINTTDTRSIYKNRLAGKETPGGSYVFYYKQENDMLRNKILVNINNETVQHQTSDGHIAGWLYQLKGADVLKFSIDSFTPYDEMTFIVNAQPGKEYFLKERK